MKVKRPSFYVSPLLTNVFWRIDWLLSIVFRTKRKLDRATAIASYSKNLYSNEKIIKTLETEFVDIHHYVKEISSL
jgi:dihydroflavonol-4-reductase